MEGMAMALAKEQPLRARENTRARLIEAGRALFYTRDYASISVDAIAKEAGFTRAAFYLHFAGKDDLLAAMMMAESHRNDRFFGWFEREPPSRESIESFLRTMLRNNRGSPAVGLFHLAALQNDAARAAFQANRLRLMALMGNGFPAFRPARDDSVAETRRVAEAILATMQYEQLVVREAEIGDPALVEQMLLAVADHLCALHARYPTV
jgi:AcrR family transcriptional regulator